MRRPFAPFVRSAVGNPRSASCSDVTSPRRYAAAWHDGVAGLRSLAARRSVAVAALFAVGVLFGGLGGGLDGVNGVTAVARLSAAEPNAAASPVRRGTVKFETSAGESRIAERFRLTAHEFTFEEEPLPEVSRRIAVSQVRFPSPLKTTSEANNTVHGELFYPKKEERVPGVIVLHILGGDFELARLFANSIAQHGSAALFIKMPYYGPRRDPNSGRRMISKDPKETVEGMTQAVLDIRRAAAFLAADSRVDSQRLGVFGISLGGITGALAASAEPRLNNVCLLLAGGDLARIAWESRELETVRAAFLAQGGSREEFYRLMSEVDPARYGENVRGRRILMLNARDDEVIPRACTEALWESFGKPDIEWYTGGHYSVARHIFTALDRTSKFFSTAEPK